jgi:hypothetical protein
MNTGHFDEEYPSPHEAIQLFIVLQIFFYVQSPYFTKASSYSTAEPNNNAQYFRQSNNTKSGRKTSQVTQNFTRNGSKSAK